MQSNPITSRPETVSDAASLIPASSPPFVPTTASTPTTAQTPAATPTTATQNSKVGKKAEGVVKPRSDAFKCSHCSNMGSPAFRTTQTPTGKLRYRRCNACRNVMKTWQPTGKEEKLGG
jgi:hypothetical protein